MATVTFTTPEGNFTIEYRLAVGVAAAKVFVANMRFGQWLGDMGNAAHQWNDGLPSRGRRFGDHTAWSADGPAEVVKAFDWKPQAPPPGKPTFKTWLLAQLDTDRYRGVCKFINLDNGQWSGRGTYQGWSSDVHLHWSYLPGAVNSPVNPIADYYREVIQEDDVTPQDIEAVAQRTVAVLLGADVPTIPAMTGGQKTAKFGPAVGFTLSRSVALLTEATEDDAEAEQVLASLAALSEQGGRIEEKLAAIPGADPAAWAEQVVQLLLPHLPKDDPGRFVDALRDRLAV